MKTIVMLWTLLQISTLLAADIPAPAVQIAAAILAAPEELRAGAAVLGYNAKGELVKLREGKNEMVCLGNDPTKNTFSVACYHRDLEPFMARGRELLAQKITGKERNDIRFKEVETGKLPMPDFFEFHATMNYRVKHYPSVALCQFALDRIETQDLFAAITVHRHLLIGDTLVRDNPFYIPPEKYLPLPPLEREHDLAQLFREVGFDVDKLLAAIVGYGKL